jgi:hypothetical protein
MTNSIKDLLAAKNFEQPDEIKTIIEFVEQKYHEKPQVKISSDLIIITVSNAGVAGLFRMELHILQKKINSKRRLMIRIG